MKGKDSRMYVEHVDFPAPFTGQPQIAVFLSLVDLIAETDRRISVSVENQNRQG